MYTHFSYPPFFDDGPFLIYEKILAGIVKYPPHFDLNAKDIIKGFLTANLSSRLGNLVGGAKDVMNHLWFEGVDWQAVLERKIQPPIIPVVVGPGDTRNFEQYPEEQAKVGEENQVDPFQHYFLVSENLY